MALHVHPQPTIRRSPLLHLTIDSSVLSPSPAHDLSPDSPLSPASSARASVATSHSATTPPTSAASLSDWALYSALCLYDFASDDPDHLPFRKNEILDIVKQEPSGWWAAARQGGTVVGWIPSTFVQPLSPEMADRLRGVREELRVFDYDAERLYCSAPITRLDLYDLSPSTDTEDPWVSMNEPAKLPSSLQMVTPTDLVSGRDFPPVDSRLARDTSPIDSYFFDTSDDPRVRAPPSPLTPMPHPPPFASPAKSAPVSYNKPTPPTPDPSLPSSSSSSKPSSSHGLSHTASFELSRSRSESAAAVLGAAGRTLLRWPLRTDSVSVDGDSGADSASSHTSHEAPGTSDEETQRVRAMMLHLPWYLRPSYGLDDLLMDADGYVKAGSLPALVEKLVDPNKSLHDQSFRDAFLMTFRTFMTADQFFDLLVERYQMDHPSNLSNDEFAEWKESQLRPTQHRVLTVLTMWLEDHRMLEEEPHIARRLTDFLALIVAPAPLAITAKLIQESLERLTFALPNTSPQTPRTPRRARKTRANRNELLQFEPADIAEQLALAEHALYGRIAPQECLAWAKTQVGRSVGNLVAFCATHDRLAAWVKMSILANDVLGKRADTIDFWIKVAEKCRSLNNFSSLSAVLTALSSAVLTRLHLTWAHSGRRSHLQPLLRFNEPRGGWTAWRRLQRSAEGPCVPFITMHLTDIVHIGDLHSDVLARPAADGPPLVHFRKRQRWADAVGAIVRFQGRRYALPECEPVRRFVEGQLRAAGAKDQGWFWLRSQEVQQMERVHADIRKGLEAAGF